MAADSRIMKDDSPVSDQVMKVFKTPYFILGVAGMFDVYRLDKYKQRQCDLISDVIAKLIAENEYESHAEFLKRLDVKLSCSCSIMEAPEYHLLFGYKDSDQYILHNIVIEHDNVRYRDEYYLQSFAFAVGMNNLVPAAICIHEDWNLDRMETIASETVRCCIEIGEMYAKPNQVGGIVHTVHLS